MPGGYRNKVHDTVSAFEAALRAVEPELAEPGIERILLAIDGSNQDQTAVAFATTLARWFAAPIDLLLACDVPVPEAEHERYLRSRQAEIEALGLSITALEPIGPDKPYRAILDHAQNRQTDLIVISSPFLEDLNELGHDSVGTTLETLLARSRIPILVIREQRDETEKILSHPILMVVHVGPENERPASWCLELARRGGELRVILVVDLEALDEMRHLLGDHLDESALDSEELEILIHKEHAGLIAAIQRRAAKLGIHCRISVRVGEPIAVMAGCGNEDERLIVIGVSPDHLSAPYQEAIALVRESGNPVLLVP